MRKPNLIVAAVTAGAFIVLGYGTPALAHIRTAEVFKNGARLGYSQVDGNHVVMTVCDDEADGIGFYGRFELENGQIIDLSDSNGASSPCASQLTPTVNGVLQRIYRFEAVSRNGQSSGWKSA